MLRLMFFTDPHLADHGPLGRKDDYKNAVLAKLEWLMQEGYERSVDQIICGGDWFHIKRPNHVSHELVSATTAILKRSPQPIFTVAGNHDQSPDGSHYRQPLAVLESANVVQILKPGVPYFTDERVVTLLSRPYNAQRTADPEYYAPTENELGLIAESEGTTVIMVAHGDVLPPGDERPYPYVNVDKIPGIEKIDLFLCGHIHENLGMSTIPGSPGLFINPASLGRTARTQANYARQVQAVIIEVGGKDTPLHTTMIDVPMAPAIEVFEAKGVDEKEPVSDGIQQFVTTLGQGLRVEQLTIDELLAGIDGLDQDVGRLVKLYLEESE